jgi:alkylhydroperoxidase/carboxymuconolactone decarboxylase family protein YurZ
MLDEMMFRREVAEYDVRGKDAVGIEGRRIGNSKRPVSNWSTERPPHTVASERMAFGLTCALAYLIYWKRPDGMSMPLRSFICLAMTVANSKVMVCTLRHSFRPLTSGLLTNVCYCCWLWIGIRALRWKRKSCVLFPDLDGQFYEMSDSTLRDGPSLTRCSKIWTRNTPC